MLRKRAPKIFHLTFGSKQETSVVLSWSESVKTMKWWLDTSHAFVGILVERKRKKALVSYWRDERKIGRWWSKVEEKMEENGNGSCWLERKKKVPRKFHLIYFGLITRMFNGECTGDADNDSVRYYIYINAIIYMYIYIYMCVDAI